MSPQSQRDTGFRGDIEGVRAVAVLLVLAYHAGIPGIVGGYVGVDVFFVLSGFLITGLLIRELDATGRISLREFYARRARRLLPASALVLLVTAVASAFVMPPLRMPDIAGDIAAAAAYVSNIRFALQATDYLGSELAPSPVLHFWSLGVEEQFYLFWPALLALVAGSSFLARDRAGGQRRVGLTLAVVFVASLALSIWLTGVQQPWAFFSLPTRAWELALGGMLALPVAARFVPRGIAPLMAWAGLGLVVLAALILDTSTPFPGTAALIPTIGCALIVAAGLPAVVAADRRVRIPGPTTLLSLPPVRFFGRISYSLYLWHWPVLVLPAVAFGHLPGVARLALAGVAIVIAWASTRFVEDPIRHGRYVGKQATRNLALAGVTTLVVATFALGLGAWTQRALIPAGPAIGGTVDEVPLPTDAPSDASSASPGSASPTTTPSPSVPSLASAPVPADLVPSLSAARDDLPIIYSDGCHLDPATVQPETCVFGDTSSETSIVLFGDSHAAQWFPALERLANERHLRLISLTKSACASADVPIWSDLYNRPYDECAQWRELALARIKAEHPALVVVSNARHYALIIDGASASSVDHEDVWSAGLTRTIDDIKATGSDVLVIGDTVRMDEDPPVCLSASLDDVRRCSAPRKRAVATARLAADQQVATSTGASFIDPTPWQCFTDPCPPVIGRFLVYRDTHHMTATFARALAERLWAVMPQQELAGAKP